MPEVGSFPTQYTLISCGINVKSSGNGAFRETCKKDSYAVKYHLLFADGKNNFQKDCLYTTLFINPLVIFLILMN
jgi:hypothetical protein